ncbi:hypothetical protein JRQ81_009372 [Phrynocephalus forsythii]|uniref:Uncharacterized protein n=1 Tax=Phrynocephalus forsythii TaxID=171643 RepID=A0A9Q0XAL8_9SAUR|nr:hypothetical protein JRQ81_009372 [Phrynocephalus forsythii]
MESPKKSLVCNLNHVHLQHISLGLHLSRHPELREEAETFVPPGNRTAYPACRQPGAPETVDANSNHPSLVCQCCGSHPLPLEVKAGLGRPEQALANGLALKEEEEEEEEEEEDLGSPSEPDTSSVSSCSDLSLDDTPVSCKAFPGEEVQSPAESQPNIVPLEDAQSLAPQAQANERSLNLNIQAAGCPLPRVWDSPDSLGSSSSLESNSDLASPSPQTLVERPLASSSRPPQLAPPPPSTSSGPALPGTPVCASSPRWSGSGFELQRPASRDGSSRRPVVGGRQLQPGGATTSASLRRGPSARAPQNQKGPSGAEERRCREADPRDGSARGRGPRQRGSQEEHHVFP